MESVATPNPPARQIHHEQKNHEHQRHLPLRPEEELQADDVVILDGGEAEEQDGIGTAGESRLGARMAQIIPDVDKRRRLSAAFQFQARA